MRGQMFESERYFEADPAKIHIILPFFRVPANILTSTSSSQQLREVLAETERMLAGSNMGGSRTRGFPFMKLPPELRDKIYRYYLILPDPVIPTVASNTSFVSKHYKNCLLGTHVWSPRWGRRPVNTRNILECTTPFTGIKQSLPVPESVLSILLVNRQINAEATHIFYRFNNFVFRNVRSLHYFLGDIGERYIYLGELSFVFSSGHARDVFLKLQNCPFLTKLHIDMRYNAPDVRLNKRGTLASATGMRELREIRGIKVLDLVGQDCRRVAAMAGQSDREGIDIMDDKAIGPRLRRDLMTPRPEGS